MNVNQALEMAKKFTNPQAPGKGRNPYLALLMGLLLGPIGIGMYLRSVAQFAWCFACALALVLITGMSPELAGTLAGVVFGPLRVWYDNRWEREASGGNEFAVPTGA
ncbi:MAG: hypothetical protein ACREJD_03090 [Phycisphaerales bacterium]